MLIKKIDEVKAKAVEMEGAKDVTVRVLFGPADGAPTFAMRVFEVAGGGHTPYHEHPFEHEVNVPVYNLSVLVPGVLQGRHNTGCGHYRAQCVRRRVPARVGCLFQKNAPAEQRLCKCRVRAVRMRHIGHCHKPLFPRHTIREFPVIVFSTNIRQLFIRAEL